FHGRGQFASPVIGLSNGWAWLCSSSIAYQELTDAFKSGKTLGSHGKKPTGAAAKAAANGEVQTATPDIVSSSEEWTDADARRVEVNLDRVAKLGYAAWLLSNGNEAPVIGGYKVPNELLPSPQVFARTLGRLRASASRRGTHLEFRSACVVPGITLGL